MKLREFKFNSLKNPFMVTTLCVKDGDKSYEGQTIGDTLRMLPVELADREIEETRWFFNTFVITLKGLGDAPEATAVTGQKKG